MIRRRQQKPGSLEQVANETADLVSRLVHQHNVLKAENEALRREVARLSSGWDELRRLARLAPRKRRPRAAR